MTGEGAWRGGIVGVASFGIGQLGGKLSVVLHTRSSHLREFRGHIMKPEEGCPNH